MQIFFGRLVFPAAYLDSLFCVVGNFNCQRQQVMIQIVAFVDTEKKLFFRVPERFAGRRVVSV
jgi:hypothetical protein